MTDDTLGSDGVTEEAEVSTVSAERSDRRQGPTTGARIVVLLYKKAMGADAIASALGMDPSYIRTVLKMLVEANILRTWTVPQRRKKPVRLYSWADDDEPPKGRTR